MDALLTPLQSDNPLFNKYLCKAGNFIPDSPEVFLKSNRPFHVLMNKFEDLPERETFSLLFRVNISLTGVQHLPDCMWSTCLG